MKPSYSIHIPNPRTSVKMVLTIIFYLITYSLFGQNAEVIDSLLTYLKNHQKDSSYVEALNELSWQYRKTDATKSLHFAGKAEGLSDSLDYRNGKLTSLNRAALVSFYQRDFASAEKQYLYILEQEKKDNNLYGIGRAQIQLGEISKNMGDFRKALVFGLESLKTYEEFGEPRFIGMVHNNLGDIYRNMGEFNKSLDHLLKNLKIKEELRDTIGMGLAYINLSAFHIETKVPRKAIEYLEKSKFIFTKYNDPYELSIVHNNLGIAHYNLKNYDTAFFNYKKTLALQEKVGIVNKDAGVYNNLGAIFFSKNQVDSALYYYNRSIKIQEGENLVSALEAHANIGEIYYGDQRYGKAIEQFLKALEISKASNKNLARLSALRHLSNSYSKLKQHELALDYNNRYISLNDSLNTSFRSAVQLKEEYEESKKREEIAEVNAEKYRAEASRNRILAYSLLIGLVLLAGLFFSIFRVNKQRQKIKVALKEKEIEEQKVARLLQKQEIESLDMMIEGREKERRRIAQDLHDRLGSMLSMVKVHFKSVEDNIEQIKSLNLEQYKKANNLLDEACDEVRKVAHHMASGTIVQFGLVPAIEELIKTLDGNNQIKIEFITHGIDDRLHTTLEIPVYRIIQELISNIIKHSKATSATIQLILREKILNLTVEDDGIGFDSLKVDSTGMGLKSVSTRVDKINGELSIDSSTQSGTIITIDIPINEEL